MTQVRSWRSSIAVTDITQLADACVVRMSELNRDCRVFTIDKREFEIYRRFERQLIPLVAPS